MVHTLEMRVEIPDNVLAGIMSTAFASDYGACWRWCEPAADGWLMMAEDEIKSVTVCDPADPGTKYIVGWDIIQRGMQNIVHLDRDHSIIGRITEAVFDDDADVLDSGDVDTIVQFGLFDKELYT